MLIRGNHRIAEIVASFARQSALHFGNDLRLLLRIGNPLEELFVAAIKRAIRNQLTDAGA